VALYRDRRDAGRQLSHALAHHARRDDLLVLALPRGGVAVGLELAGPGPRPLRVTPPSSGEASG